MAQAVGSSATHSKAKAFLSTWWRRWELLHAVEPHTRTCPHRFTSPFLYVTLTPPARNC